MVLIGIAGLVSSRYGAWEEVWIGRFGSSIRPFYWFFHISPRFYREMLLMMVFSCGEERKNSLQEHPYRQTYQYARSVAGDGAGVQVRGRRRGKVTGGAW